MIRIFSIAFLLLVVFSSTAQQITQYSQWSYNQFATNPALAGIKNCLDMRSSYRMQWAGFDGAPKSGLITINTPLKKKQKELNSSFHGMGLKVEQDQWGNFENLAISLAYAMHFPIDPKRRISFGLAAGVQQFGFDKTKVTTIDADPAIAQSTSNFLLPLIGAGAWYHTENWYAGISTDQLAKNRWVETGYDARFRIHTRLVGGTRFELDETFTLLPVAMIRIPPAGPLSMDLNLHLSINSIVTVGLGYRNTDGILGFFRLRFRKLTVGYSMDYITSSLQGGHRNTHEISLMFNGCYSKQRGTASCPLFE